MQYTMTFSTNVSPRVNIYLKLSQVFLYIIWDYFRILTWICSLYWFIFSHKDQLRSYSGRTAISSIHNSLDDPIDFISFVFHRLSRLKATMIKNKNDIKSMDWMETQLHWIVQALGHWTNQSLPLRKPKQWMTTIHPSCFCQFLYIILRIFLESIWIQKKFRMWII